MFTVSVPPKGNKTVKYEVAGCDEQGQFTNWRSFEEFVCLAQALRRSWPGCFIPTLPANKVLNYKSEEFISDRCALLEEFL